MMPNIADNTLAIGAPFVAMLIVKVTLALLLALCAARLARRSRAAVRHVLLATAFAAMLVLPIASVLARRVPVEVPVAARIAESPVTMVFMDGSAVREPVNTGATAGVRPSGPLAVSASALLVSVWSAGVLIFLLPVMVGLMQMRVLRQRGLPWCHGRDIARQLALDAGIRRRVDVLLHEAISGPVTCGLVRPALLLPLDAQSWGEEELRRAIVHELEHVRRADWATQCLARVLCAVYWFHPLTWIAWRQLGLEAERACDDAVLRRAEATSYADQLVVLAQRLSADAHRPMLAMANRADLSTRVRAVLDTAQVRGRAGTVCVAVTLAIAGVLVTAIAPLHAVPRAQVPAAAQPRPSFETASIRRNESGGNEQYVRFDLGGGATVQNMTLFGLIGFAYQAQDFRIEGAPGWARSDRFDIVAKVADGTPVAPPGPPGRNELQLRMRTLLEERFKLVLREETREMPIFELVLAKRDGKPGPQLRPAATDCAAMLAARAGAARGGRSAPADADTAFARGRSGPNSPVQCGMTMGFGRIRFGGNPMTVLTDSLAGIVRRKVVDRTGLTGNWDFEMTYTPDPEQLPPGPPPPGVQLPAVDPNGPSLFTALEEQLGLKLNAARGPVTVLVIERAEPPTPN